MRSTFYEVSSIGLLLATLFFYYRCVEFLAQKDYVAGVIALGIGFLVTRAGVELARLSFYARREEDRSQ